MKKSSNNDEESIVSFARISNDQKKWAFSLVPCKSAGHAAELLLWLQRLPFRLPLLVCDSAFLASEGEPASLPGCSPHCPPHSLFSLSSVSSSCSFLLLLIGNFLLKNYPGSRGYLACIAIISLVFRTLNSHSSCALKSYLEWWGKALPWSSYSKSQGWDLDICVIFFKLLT